MGKSSNNQIVSTAIILVTWNQQEAVAMASSST